MPAALALAVVLAQATATLPQTTADAEVIVRAERAEAALTKCRTSGCSTLEDARASIALAEAQFRQGDYRRARGTLHAAIRRNQQGAAGAPRAVAALYEASATVNLHYGDMADHRRAVGGMARTLRAHLPADDLQVILADVRLADMWADQGEIMLAERTYGSIERRYAARGYDRLAAFVRLRTVALLIRRARHAEAGRLLAKSDFMPGLADPAVVPMKLALAARLAARRGDEDAVERLLANLRTDPAQPPLLVGSAPERRGEDLRPVEVVSRIGGPTGAKGVRWVDVGYLVTPDGKVIDPEVLRSAGATGWATPYVERIARRRYAPTVLPDGVPGRYRVERLTFRADRIVPSGSLIKGPSGDLRVVSLDMTRADAVAKPID